MTKKTIAVRSGLLCQASFIAAFFFCICSAAPSSAAEEDNRAAVEINGCSYTQQGNTLSYDGCFELKQGSRRITSDNATITRGNKQFSRVELIGGPATWSETGDDGLAFSARASQISYDVVQQKIVLRGDVQIRQGEQEIASQTMRYDLRTGRVEGGDADDPDSRVKMRFPAVLPEQPDTAVDRSTDDTQG